jgi:NAD(P) transhydrogenase
MSTRWNLVVIGSGPAGQKAAIQAAKSGFRVALVEREREVGGACVHSGTIPSKALREQARRQRILRRDLAGVSLRDLLADVDDVIQAHDHFMGEQLRRNDVTLIRGRASIAEDGTTVRVDCVDGSQERLVTQRILIATGSRPRHPPHLPIDHENVLDSDSILSLAYVPRSLLVLGSGVIASEYAATFAALGCKVTQIDRAMRPLAFLDPDLSEFYTRELTEQRGEFIGQRVVESLSWDGATQIRAQLDDGRSLHADKALVALGRSANIEALQLEALAIRLTSRGDIAVDERYQSSHPRIYAAGDVIGPPALASTAMEQGRRAAGFALGIELDQHAAAPLPSGIYTLPEISTIGLTESQAREQYGDVLIGRARFAEIARGHLSGTTNGLLKMIAAPDGARVLGVHIAGDCATELVHVAQLGLHGGATVDTYVDTAFNFPTMAEAYRVAALDIVRQRGAHSALDRSRAIHAHA